MTEQLSKDELIRYSRQLMLQPVGKTGQEKLKAAKVLIVGVGGLGCPAAQYLAAGGIGELWLLDDDNVALSNLQRQILFGQNDIDKSKVDAAAEKLAANNPNVSCKTLAERASQERLAELCNNVDIVLD
ncbi:MAG: HesA/MoeB/ThiF family protein, partial [Gammaproteobacteria bacterium]|nr:HesA/MoeB/ThiF family protein [Gammaproteobacteria bacterium]